MINNLFKASITTTIAFFVSFCIVGHAESRPAALAKIRLIGLAGLGSSVVLLPLSGSKKAKPTQQTSAPRAVQPQE